MSMRETLAFLFLFLSISFFPSTQLRIDYRLEASTPVNAFLVCQPSLHSLLLSMLFLHSELELLSSTRAVPLYEHFIKPKYIVANFRNYMAEKSSRSAGWRFQSSRKEQPHVIEFHSQSDPFDQDTLNSLTERVGWLFVSLNFKTFFLHFIALFKG